jgi:hypothetical protein
MNELPVLGEDFSFDDEARYRLVERGQIYLF